jgi:hypothetical protein
MASRVEVIVWKDVLVLSDDGRSVVSDYEELFEIGMELHRRYPQGWGMMTIIPNNAVPPAEPVRAAINQALKRVSDTLVAASWAIEGVGFQGAMARAVLTGLRFFSNATYARHVSSSVDESINWLLPHLPGGERRGAERAEALQYIGTRRESLAHFQSTMRAASEKAASRAE